MSTLTFNDGIFVQEALKNFVASLTPLNAFSHDYSSYAAAKGNAVYVPRVEAITATTFNQSYIGTGGNIGTITVNLDQHRINTADFTDDQMKNSSAATWDNVARQLGQGLGKIVTQDIWSAVTITNFGAALVTTSSASYSKTQLRALKVGLRKRNVPTDKIAFICNEDVHDAILGDSNILQAYAYGDNSPIKEGKMGRVLGFDIYPTNILPTNSISLNAFAVHPDALAVAMRQYSDVVPSGAYEGFETAADPVSGITMTYRRLYNKLTGTWHFNVECLFGYSKALTLGLAVCTTPDA